jgi:hypothetical protein
MTGELGCGRGPGDSPDGMAKFVRVGAGADRHEGHARVLMRRASSVMNRTSPSFEAREAPK